MLGYLGLLHLDQGRMDEARASLEACELLLRAVNDPLELGKLLATRGRSGRGRERRRHSHAPHAGSEFRPSKRADGDHGAYTEVNRSARPHVPIGQELLMRTSAPILTLTLAFTFACTPERADNSLEPIDVDGINGGDTYTGALGLSVGEDDGDWSLRDQGHADCGSSGVIAVEVLRTEGDVGDSIAPPSAARLLVGSCG